MNIESLHNAISAVCPIHGVNTSRKISFQDVATTEQRAAGQAIADAWNFDVPTAEELAKEAQQSADAVERADAKNVAALKYLVKHTNAEIRAFIQSNIDVASVTDLASAKACLNRIENRLEDLAVGLAVLVRRELR